MLSSKSVLHRRLRTFVDWIAPDSEREQEIRDQSARIRERIKAKAAADGLTVRSTPNSGSFAKRTGLRRHMRGTSEIEGQDIDLAFVVSPKTKDAEMLDSLLDRFLGYAQEAYPDNAPDEPTNSSVVLTFQNTKLQYDIVPMLAVSGTDDEQILLQRNGNRRRTSVQKHTEFVRSRNWKSNEQPGRVKVNECIRLFKWWRCVHFEDDTIPSIVCDLVCAKAFDERGVRSTYGETLADWFGWAAHAVRSRTPISFNDYLVSPLAPRSGAEWQVIDPVNRENNIVERWNWSQLDELSDKLETTRDMLNRAISQDERQQHPQSLSSLEFVFGSAIRHHCGGDEA